MPLRSVFKKVLSLSEQWCLGDSKPLRTVVSRRLDASQNSG